MAPSIETIFDLDRYPLDRPGGNAYAELVATKRHAWRTGGACALPGLLRRDVARRAAEELRAPLASRAFQHKQAHNIYFTDDVDALPADLARARLTTAHCTLTCDQMEGTIIRAAYEWAPLCTFIKDVLDLPALYPMADPMACLNVMAYGEGDELGWHFDRAEFAVTILLQAADAGGEFEYRRGLRTAADPNFTGVRRLLARGDDEVRRCVSAAGDMTVFAGFGAAHRVTPVMGNTPRVMAVLSYMGEPAYQYGPADRLRFYGRASPGESSAHTPLPSVT